MTDNFRQKAMKFCLRQWLDWENECMSQTEEKGGMTDVDKKKIPEDIKTTKAFS